MEPYQLLKTDTSRVGMAIEQYWNGVFGNSYSIKIAKTLIVLEMNSFYFKNYFFNRSFFESK